MKTTSRYTFEDDGRLWTQFNWSLKRPSTVEEMEGYCRERDAAFRFLPDLASRDDAERPMAMAV